MLPQRRAAALMSARIKLVLRPADQRRDEQRGEIEVVERLHREAHRRDQILRRERLGQREAVGPGDGDVQRLQARDDPRRRSEEHTSELQSLMRISYAVFCLKKKKNKTYTW